MQLIKLSELKLLIFPVAESQNLKYTPELLQSYWYPPLCDYTAAEIAYGIQQALKSSGYNLKPFEIIKHLKTGLGHPEAQIAWSYCLHGECSSGWITDTIAAAYGMCSESFSSGDRIGAKQVFLQAYEQQVGIAEGTKTPPKWFWSGESEALEKMESAIKLVNRGHMPKSRAVAVIFAEEWKHQRTPEYVRQLQPPQRQILIGNDAPEDTTVKQLESLSTGRDKFLSVQADQNDIHAKALTDGT